MSENSFIVIKMAEAKQPYFKENKREGYINYGKDNKYPDYLIDLFTKSAKHGAIIRNKVKYIIGNGISTESGKEDFLKKFSINALTKKIAIDLELFNGSYIEVIWSKLGRIITEVNHIPFTKIRTNKDNTQYWYRDEWKSFSNMEDADIVNNFQPSATSDYRQIIFIKEYDPSGNAYPFVPYVGALNYIESDIEVSRHILGNASTGFTPSKLITLPNGEPSPDVKKSITKDFQNTYTGSEGRKFILSFVQDNSRAPIINDLGQSDLSKEDFTSVDNIIRDNIFAGHEITSPALFGIAQPGKLGASSELKDAYEIFKNTYANARQRTILSFIDTISYYAGYEDKYSIIPVDPIGIQFDAASIISVAPKAWVLEKLGIDAVKYKLSEDSEVLSAINSLSPLVANKVLESMTPNEVRALATLMPKQGADSITDVDGQVAQPGATNEAMRSLTGRQHQQLLRIIKQFGQGKLTKEQAMVMLKSSLGLSDEEINTMLSIDEQPLKMSAEDEVSIFAQFGEERKNFEILKTSFKFSEESEMQAFADVTQAESNVLDLISKDKRITPEVIAKTLKISIDKVQQVINAATEKGFIKSKETTQGKGIDSNIIIERTLTQPISKIVEDIKPKTTSFLIRYSYEWLPEIPSSERDTASHPSRDFCRALMRLDRIYSRTDIEQLSARLGYSVFDRRGGWWNDNGENKPSCRHRWASQIVIRK